MVRDAVRAIESVMFVLQNPALSDRSSLLEIQRDGSPIKVKMENVSLDPQVAEKLEKATRDSAHVPVIRRSLDQRAAKRDAISRPVVMASTVLPEFRVGSRTHAAALVEHHDHRTGEYETGHVADPPAANDVVAAGKREGAPCSAAVLSFAATAFSAAAPTAALSAAAAARTAVLTTATAAFTAAAAASRGRPAVS